MMTLFESLAAGRHEAIALCSDPDVGYRGIIAIHSTRLGPAVGGTRWWTYASEHDAITDALRLSRGMSYKNALAGLPLGGGKSVILGGPEARDRAAILRAHGRAVDQFAGRYITAEDVGTSPADMELIAESTQYVAGRENGSGDPSPFTARGVFRATQAAAHVRWGSDDLSGRTVALQGCGNVGYHLALELDRAGARIVASDIDPAKVERVVKKTGAASEAPDRIHQVEADIFAPCALGAVINDTTLPVLRVEIVSGGANNQLLEPRHGDALAARGILYVPDYVANAGGVSYGGAVEVLGLSGEQAKERVEAIYDTTLMVLERAARDGVGPHLAADRLAEERIRAGRTPTA
jgi:leucine dehydrogenase